MPPTARSRRWAASCDSWRSCSGRRRSGSAWPRTTPRCSWAATPCACCGCRKEHPMAERTTIIDGHLSLAADDELLSGTRRFTGADASTHLEGAWLDGMGADAAVAGALVSVAPGPLGPADDLERHHRDVTEAIAADPRLSGSITVHPFYEASEVRTVVRRLVGEQGYRAVDLHPTAQCFLPHR